MSDPQALHIFVTGVVGRSMGSGKFSAQDIDALMEAAYATFIKTFGDPYMAEGRAQQTQPLPSISITEAYAHPNKVQTVSAVGISAEGKSFRIWQNDSIKFGKKPSPLGKPWGEVTWAEVYDLCAQGNEYAQGYLKYMIDLPTSNPKYASFDETRRSRARAILAAATPAQSEQDAEERTPF